MQNENDENSGARSSERREETKEGFYTIETLFEEDIGGSDGQEREKKERAEVRASHPKRHRQRRNDRARDV